MPVCIAALGDDGRMIVVAADRLGEGGYSALMPDEIGYVRLKAVGKDMLFLSSCQSQDTEQVFSQAVALAGDLETVGVEAFADHVLRAQTETPISGRRADPSLATGPDGKPRPWCSDAEFLVVGMEAGQPRIYRINEAGKFAFQERDYAVIGDGEPTAWAALALVRYHRGLPPAYAVYGVYRAKQQGELYVRVGSNTDMAIVDGTGIRFFDEPSIRLLEDISSQQTGALLGLAERNLIEQHIASLPYMGVPRPDEGTTAKREPLP